MCLANAKQRFSKHEAGFNELLKHNIIKVDKDDNLIINFLDEQMNEFVNVSEKRSIAGKKGVEAKAKQLLKFAKAKLSNIDIDKDIDKEIDKDIINYLNEKSKKNFRVSSQKTKDLIKARINEGYTLEDFKKVIDNKCKEWLNDIKWDKYLRPETLFSNKFEGYLNIKEINEDIKPDTSKRIEW
jgi:uncharacterized phage protein (TIGR02220 family)